MSDKFQVPKKKVEVLIAFKQKGLCVPEPYSIFLSEFSPRHRGEESLAEFLNEPSLFFPAVKRDANEFFIINSSTVYYVMEEREISEPVVDDITIHLMNGETLAVGLHEIMPEYSARPIDYLNQDDVYIYFIHKQKPIFINKNKIERVSGL